MPISRTGLGVPGSAPRTAPSWPRAPRLRRERRPTHRHLGAVLALYLRPHWPRVLLLAVLLLGSTGLQLAIPQLLRQFLDLAAAGGDGRRLSTLALSFLGGTLAGQGLAVAATYVGTDIGWRATNGLRTELLRHCLGLDFAVSQRYTPGVLIERIDGDCATLHGFLSRFSLVVAGNLLLLIGVLLALFRESWWLGLLGTAFALLSLLVLDRVRGVATPYWQAGRQASAELFGFVEERLAGVEDLRANGALAYAMRRFHEVARTEFRAGRTARLVADAGGGGTGLLLRLGGLAALAAGAVFYGTGAVTIGTVYLVMHYTELLARPLRVLVTQAEELQRAGVGIGRVEELLRLQPAVRDSPGSGRALPDGPLSVAFAGVSFTYPPTHHTSPSPPEGAPRAAGLGGEGVPTLHGITFSIAPGTVLGLLGQTGSGKTTLTRLLFRFYDPAAGAISLGGEDLRAVPLAELRRRIGLVTQDVQLLHASVRDNLTFFDRGIPDSRLRQVVDDLGLAAWYRRLPQGLDTVLDAAGLSAGEAQLLALTRVFLRDPGLLVLDEASSRLDPLTERLLEGVLDRLLGGTRPCARTRTAIVIAHRLSTIRRADEIMILERGRIVEYGQRAQLAADPGSRYARLLRTAAEGAIRGEPASGPAGGDLDPGERGPR
jgi:ATP-binding cassette subfamily B protein